MTKHKVELTEESIVYMSQWEQQGKFTDFDLFYHLGEYELCAIRLVDGGVMAELFQSSEYDTDDLDEFIESNNKKGVNSGHLSHVY